MRAAYEQSDRVVKEIAASSMTLTIGAIGGGMSGSPIIDSLSGEAFGILSSSDMKPAPPHPLGFVPIFSISKELKNPGVSIPGL